MRVTGLGHNIGNVLLLLGIPISVLGILALPWQARDRALRPLVLVSAATFLVTSLVFPVATTWGTFLHAAAPGPRAADRLGARRAGRRAGAPGTPPRLDAARGLAGSAPGGVRIGAVLRRDAARFAGGAQATERTYAVLAREMAAIGAPFDGSAPVIHDFPIWLAETARDPDPRAPGRDPGGRPGPRPDPGSGRGG